MFRRAAGIHSQDSNDGMEADLTNEQTLPALRASGLAWRSALAALMADRYRLALIAVLGLTAAIHLPSIDTYFHGDDFVALVDIATTPVWRHLEDVFLFQDTNFYWRPLGQVYYLLLYQTAGLNPVPFQVANLAVFLISILLLDRLVRCLGLSRPVALLACLIFAFYPNHVVSVTWISNGPRLLAQMFVLAALVLLVSASRRQSWRLELLAWLAMAAAVLSDETALSLAFLPVFLCFVLKTSGTRLFVRLLAYGLPTVALVPLQFSYSVDDEPRLASYAFGRHVIDQLWALSGQLTLPLNAGGEMARGFASFSELEWGAGALGVMLGLSLLLFGSGRGRFFILWVALALAPFALWEIPFTAPRYVYMAAAPFAIIVAWLLMSCWQLLDPRLRLASAIASVTALVILGAIAGYERNRDWRQSTEPYRVLAQGLKQAVPQVEPGSRLVIYYGVWDGFNLWPEVVVRTVYRDASLNAVSVSKQFSETDAVRRGRNDVVVFFTDDRFIVVPRQAGLREPN